MNKRIKVGIIGCGRVAENHVEAIRKCENCLLVAAAGGRRAQEFGKRHNIPIMETEELCKAEEIDAVLILTPPKTHFDYVIKCADAGKHILVEKPVSFCEEEIEKMIQKVRKKNVVCVPGHSYIYLPELARMKNAVNNGKLGVPTYLYLSETYYMKPDLFEKYEGPEKDVLCHQLYMMLGFLGMPLEVSAFKGEFDKKDIETGGPQVIVNFKYSTGTLVQIVVSWAADDYSADSFTFKVKIMGTKGSMNFSRLDYVETLPGGYDQPLYQEMFDAQLDWFINSCIIDKKEPLSTMEDAGNVCRLYKSIQRAIKDKKVVIIAKGKEL
ncbi:Gfo/Idh/MocA family protein [Clostridium sp. C105KSO13]|uniref:Gfo/Idh/MocA family protein n=1 Tax=Clostridium sp. C105KSO13 TaxID=1776045 RepID=UPI0007407387|nr:Gfo/Idh/MocA family oxidoreductase [Clostridium sp. C105KSO13]CUX38659.1 4-carboxy-2-hydroxymuconate-6-semialdehyde dehydrogenase [Clostridium sp. C105KSO13]